jgi:hypothetical protein
VSFTHLSTNQPPYRLDEKSLQYSPHGKAWIKDQVFEYLKQQAGDDAAAAD